jgi:hypothetical protein
LVGSFFDLVAYLNSQYANDRFGLLIQPVDATAAIGQQRPFKNDGQLARLRNHQSRSFRT